MSKLIIFKPIDILTEIHPKIDTLRCQINFFMILGYTHTHTQLI